MPIEPPFNSYTNPNMGRDPYGIPTWIVEQVNQEIRNYYDEHSGSPQVAEADEYYFIMDCVTPLDEFPPLYKLPTRHCVYTLRCETKGFDQFSGYSHVKRRLRERANNLGYSFSDDWIKAVYNASQPHYVGETKNPYARIHEHDQTIQHAVAAEHDDIEPDGARFTAIFPPESVVNIEWISGGKDAAKHQERKTATRLHENNGYFVYPPPNTPRSGSSNQ
jgi:predicted GIY-YIG superfamily endonuclease